MMFSDDPYNVKPHAKVQAVVWIVLTHRDHGVKDVVQFFPRNGGPFVGYEQGQLMRFSGESHRDCAIGR